MSVCWKHRGQERTYNVDDEAHVFEVIVHVAPGASEHGLWQAPSLRVGFLAPNVGGNIAPSKVPHLDVLIIPLHGIDATPDGVEPVSVGACISRRRVVAAADVLVTDVAVLVPLFPGKEVGLGGGILEAAGGGVCRDDVVVGCVCALDDVELAAVGPVVTVSPDW